LTQFTPQWQALLPHLGIIKITGADTVKYVQGQVTCNVETLGSDRWTFGAHCDFKGKMWSFFQACFWDEALLLICPKDVIPSALSELKKYGVFSQVEITDASSEFSLIGCGTDAATYGQLMRTAEHIQLSMSTANLTRSIMITLSSTNTDLADGSAIWQALDIQSGIGAITAQTSNEYVPQMINLQALNAIDFKKGCYMGQEVVARTKYLGKNKRAGYILRHTGLVDVTAGELLEIQVGDNWRRGGQILSSGQCDNQTYIFAVLPNDTEVGTSLRLKSQPDILFQTQPLPYSIEA
jgi:folate-binding protein YgfZ